MSEEELKKEAEEHCNEVLCSVCEKVTCTKKIKCREWRDRRAGYYCGAEPREKRIAELKAKINILENCDRLGDTITEAYKEQLAQAKELLQNLIRVTWGEGWNYSLDWKAKAEQFLEETE